MGGGGGGHSGDKEDGEQGEVTESVSGSPTAGLWILHFYSGPPALLTDALMKDKTELDAKHKQGGRARTRTHVTGGKKREKDSVAQKKVTL